MRNTILSGLSALAAVLALDLGELAHAEKNPAATRAQIEKGRTRLLSQLITVRVENWSQAPLTLRNNKLKILVQRQKSEGAARVKRTPMAFPAVVLTKDLQPGEGLQVVGPKGGWFDEEWTPRDDGPVALRVVVLGHTPGAARASSHEVTVPGS